MNISFNRHLSRRSLNAARAAPGLSRRGRAMPPLTSPARRPPGPITSARAPRPHATASASPALRAGLHPSPPPANSPSAASPPSITTLHPPPQTTSSLSVARVARSWRTTSSTAAIPAPSRFRASPWGQATPSPLSASASRRRRALRHLFYVQRNLRG